MELTSERFRERLAPLPLVPGVTAVVRLDHVSAALGGDVWAKRDDLSSPVYGGNKVRKLAYLLADAKARGADTLVTMGAVGSHHVLATAIYGKEAGYDVHAVVLPQPPTDHVKEVAAEHVARGVVLHRAKGPLRALSALRRVARELAAAGKRPYVIPPGGSSPTGALGYVGAALELSEQMEAGKVPRPSAIVVALGSGSTVAGIALGLALSGQHIPIVAVRIAGPMLMNRLFLWDLVRKSAALLRRRGVTSANLTRAAMKMIEIDGTHLGRGYGFATEEGMAALALAGNDGLTLEPTYTAKAFAALVARAKANPGHTWLFWQTLAAPRRQG